MASIAPSDSSAITMARSSGISATKTHGASPPWAVFWPAWLVDQERPAEGRHSERRGQRRAGRRIAAEPDGRTSAGWPSRARPDAHAGAALEGRAHLVHGQPLVRGRAPWPPGGRRPASGRPPRGPAPSAMTCPSASTTARSATRAASSTSWVATTMAWPWPPARAGRRPAGPYSGSPGPRVGSSSSRQRRGRGQDHGQRRGPGAGPRRGPGGVGRPACRAAPAPGCAAVVPSGSPPPVGRRGTRRATLSP